MAGTNIYGNLPPSPINNTVGAMDNFYSKPVSIDPTTYNMITGFFQSRGFGVAASETTAVTLIKQAQIDGYNPINVLDSLKGLNDVVLDNIIAEILNYNRFKSSFLGYSSSIKTYHEVQRNILA